MAAGLPVTTVISLVRPTLVPTRLIAVVALVRGLLVRIGLVPLIPCGLVAICVPAVLARWLVTLRLVARRVVTIKFVAARLAWNSMLG